MSYPEMSELQLRWRVVLISSVRHFYLEEETTVFQKDDTEVLDA